MTAILYLSRTLFFCSLVLSPLILLFHHLCRTLDRSICSRTIALIWSVLLLRLCLPIPAFFRRSHCRHGKRHPFTLHRRKPRNPRYWKRPYCLHFPQTVLQ